MIICILTKAFILFVFFLINIKWIFIIVDVSPYQRKKPKPDTKEPEALTTLLASGSLDLKQEPDDEEPDQFETEGGLCLKVLLYMFCVCFVNVVR